MFIRKKTLEKIKRENREAITNAYYLGLHYHGVDKLNRELCGLPVTKLDFQLEEILRGFDKEGKIG